MAEKTENNSKLKIFVGPILTLILVLGGFIAQYATTRTEMVDVKDDMIKMEGKIDTVETKVHDLELKSAVDSNTLQSMKEDVATIKGDVKVLLEKVR